MNRGEEEWPSLGMDEGGRCENRGRKCCGGGNNRRRKRSGRALNGCEGGCCETEEESVVEEGMNRGEEEEWPNIKAISVWTLLCHHNLKSSVISQSDQQSMILPSLPP